jgi:lambda repressor-like predicted transcriptional regulator
MEFAIANRAPGRPAPEEATTPAEFIDALRRLKEWTGWSYRELEKRARSAGQTLPRTTLSAALARPGLPREELVAALVCACGGSPDEVRRWVATRRQLAASRPAARPMATRRHRSRLCAHPAIVALTLILALAVAIGVTVI